jgi:hypothetical protein
LASQSDRLTEVSGQVGTNLVATYKALGGGWQFRKSDAILSEETRNEMIKRTNWGGLLETGESEDIVNDEEKGQWRWPDW